MAPDLNFAKPPLIAEPAQVDKLKNMGFSYAAVAADSADFGLITNGTGKHFTVLWSDGSISETSTDLAFKCVLNSPIFFNKVDPERNVLVFDEAPAQLVKELLWQRRCRHPKDGKLSSEAIRSQLKELGISQTAIESAWPKVRKNLSAEGSGVRVQGKDFMLVDESFQIHQPLSINWESLQQSSSGAVVRTKENHTAETETRDLSPVSAGKARPERKPGNIWQDFVESVERKKLNLETHIISPNSFLESAQGIRSHFEKPENRSNTELLKRALASKSGTISLIGHFLINDGPENKRKVGREALDFAREVLLTALGRRSNMESAERIAFARLLEVAQPSPKSFTDSLENLARLTAFVVSLTSPTLAPLKEAFAKELSLALRLYDRPLTDEAASALKDTLGSVKWSSSVRQVVSGALIAIDSPLLRNTDFWDGLDVHSFLWLTSLPAWPTLSGKQSSRALISEATSKLLSSLKPDHALEALKHAEKFATIVDGQAIELLLRNALSANSATKLAMSAIENKDLIDSLNTQVLTTQHAASLLESQLVRTANELAEVRQSSENLNAKLASVALERTGARENERQQFELDAARVLARVLTNLDGELGENYQGRERAQSLAASLGIEPISRAGSTTEFSFEIHDDPESKAQEGQLVNVVCTGYKWSRNNQTVVLFKALVSI